MIGKLVEIHPHDAFYEDACNLLGTMWEISDMDTWEPGTLDAKVIGYMWGNPTYVGKSPLKVDDYVLGPNELGSFYAVKFEIIGE